MNSGVMNYLLFVAFCPIGDCWGRHCRPNLPKTLPQDTSSTFSIPAHSSLGQGQFPIRFNSIQVIDHFYSPPLETVHYGRALYSSRKTKISCHYKITHVPRWSL